MAFYTTCRSRFAVPTYIYIPKFVGVFLFFSRYVTHIAQDNVLSRYVII